MPLPEKGVIVARRKGDAPRVYHVIRSYRNEKGQPTNERKLIGKLDEASGMLVPNDAYYEFYDAAAAVEELPGERPVTAPLAEFLPVAMLSKVRDSSRSQYEANLLFTVDDGAVYRVRIG